VYTCNEHISDADADEISEHCVELKDVSTDSMHFMETIARVKILLRLVHDADSCILLKLIPPVFHQSRKKEHTFETKDIVAPAAVLAPQWLLSRKTILKLRMPSQLLSAFSIVK
jgi:hypothetical protein